MTKENRTSTPKVQVVVGSTRAKRIGPKIAAWVAEVGQATIPATFEIVDLKDWPLPMDDEPDIPAAGHYACAHTQAWSQKVAEGKAFVFVTPQYNWGYPAPLKNALDHLYKEWSGKPAMIVSYGGHGGGKCAGQLRQVLEALHMSPTAIMPSLTLSRSQIEANTGEVDPATQFAAQTQTLQKAFAELRLMLLSS